MTAQSDTDSKKVFDGLITRTELALQMRCTDRTIIRYERAGMPFIAMGKFRLYMPEAVRNWILSHQIQPNRPRRGRPSKALAA